MVQNEGEKMIRTFLDKHTKLKKLAITLYSTASRLKHGFPTCTNNVLRIVPKDSYEYFFGYYDKSPCIESFHSVIKREWLNRFKIRDYKQAYQLIFEYLEAFYNTKRIHSHYS